VCQLVIKSVLFLPNFTTSSHPKSRKVQLFRCIVIICGLSGTWDYRSVQFCSWLRQKPNLLHSGISSMTQRISVSQWPLCGPGSSFGIATGRSRDRIPVGARFSAPVLTGPESHPASCTMGTGSFLAVSCGRGVTLTPYPLSSAVVKK